MAARPASFVGGALTALGIAGVIIVIVELTDNFWWFLFYLGIGIIGGFALGSVSAVFRTEEKNAYLVLTGFMLASLIILTLYLAIWKRDLTALNTTISGIAVIMISAGSSVITYIGTTLMSVKPRR
ncbi:MAG: hypothetical protein ACTSSG_01875 [Candidatus Heimdallarchaeaceae archaeon]